MRKHKWKRINRKCQSHMSTCICRLIVVELAFECDWMTKLKLKFQKTFHLFFGENKSKHLLYNHRTNHKFMEFFRTFWRWFVEFETQMALLDPHSSRRTDSIRIDLACQSPILLQICLLHTKKKHTSTITHKLWMAAALWISQKKYRLCLPTRK